MTSFRDRGDARPCDAQELLLGGLDENGARRARRALTWTRLVVQDLEARRTSDSPVDLKAAREELRGLALRRACAAAEALLVSILARCLGPETYVCLGPRDRPGPRHRSPAAWWGEFLASREAQAASVPDPAAEPPVVFDGLVSFLEHARAPRAGLWRARSVWFERGPRGVERALRARLRERPHGLDAAGLRSEVGAWLLERGAVDEFEAWLPECREGDHVQRLRAWVEVMRANGPAVDPAPACSGCPRPLAAGASPRSAPVPGRGPDEAPMRYAVLARVGDGVACLAVRGSSVPPPVVERARAAAAASPEERRLLDAARPLTVRGRQAAARSCLGGARALALEPVLAAGRVAGWIRFESATPWLPCARERRLVAERWTPEVLAVFHRAPKARGERGAERAETRRWLRDWSARLRIRSAVSTVLVRRGAELRAWHADDPRIRARPASLQDVQRAWIGDSGRPLESVREAVGFCFPLVHADEVLGAWVVHGDLSLRQRADQARPSEVLGAEFRAAHFRDWHEARFGSRVAFDRHGLDVFRAARRAGGEPLELRAEAGVDTLRVSRWLAFEREHTGPSWSAAETPPVLGVPPLRARREEIPERVLWNLRFLRGGVDGTPGGWTDELAAWFWRQTWRGNEDELDAFCRSHLERLLDAPDPLDAARRAAREFGFESVDRLPSDAASSAADLAAALRSTVSSSGRANKARAGRYLGWSPSAVSGRSQER